MQFVFGTCHSRCCLHMSGGETLGGKYKNIINLLIHSALLIGYVIETRGAWLATVVGRHGLAAALLVAEHEVDPLVEVLRHVLALQRYLVLLQEVPGV